MSEKQQFTTEQKSSLKLPRAADGLLFGDDPRLLRLVKQRIKKGHDKNNSGIFAGFKNSITDPYESLDAETLGFLTQEVTLQSIDFPLDLEKLRAPIFEKILANIAHLDFRDFRDQWNNEFTIYDPEVITPHVSWAIEQIFSNLPGFFIQLAELAGQNADFANKQIDIIRNVFILGHAHGFLNQGAADYDKIKELLAYAIQQSEASPDGLKPYPAFLANLVELDDLKQTSPRLTRLKKHWTEQFARRWMTHIRTDDASKKSLSAATQHAAGVGLSPDGRPADNYGQAKKMDAYRKQRAVLTGATEPPSRETVVAEQTRTEAHLQQEAAHVRQSATTDMRDILRLYQGSDRENFHNNQQTSEKWRPFKIAAEQILNQLVTGYSKLSQASEGSDFDSAGREVLTKMMDTLGAASGDKTLDMKTLFGNDFFSLAKIEQLCLISFTALSFVERETPTIKRAIYVLDSLLVPKLNAHTDLDQTSNLFPANTPPLSFTAFDLDTQRVKALRAQQALETLRPEDGLMSAENPDFAELLAHKKTTLLGISKVLNFFARTTDKKDWLKNATFNAGALTTLFVLVGAVSGQFNFNFSRDLLEQSIQSMLKADPSTWHYLMTRAGQVGIGAGVLGTIATFAGAIGQQARESAKKLKLTTSDSDKQARESLKWKKQHSLLAVLLFAYGAYSLAPFGEQGAREAWDNFQQWREEMKADAEEKDPNAPTPFWQERNPEARDPELLEKVEKTIWGEILIGEDVYGKTKDSPIGFINTYIVSPEWTEGIGWPELNTSPMTVDLQNTQVINAADWRQEGDRIIFTLANGEEFVQEAVGTDFVIKNGLTNNKEGFVRFLDDNRVIDRVIFIPRNVARHVIFTNDEVFLPGLAEVRMLEAIDGGYEFFVVYKTAESTGEQKPEVTNLAEQKNHWEITQNQREKILRVLEQENPEAAALYQRMIAEHEAFFSDINFEENLYNYQLMLKRQADEYRAFVQSRHFYSLKYNPKTNYAKRDPKVGVLLDVMSLKEGGYYCLTAHLAAQQWFLSLGVTMDGLHGFSLYDDNGKASTRIAHVKTSLYGMIYDFTPTRPNPGEDLSSLNYNPEDPVGSQGNSESYILDEKAQAALELLQQLASVENLALVLAGLTTLGVGYLGKTGIELLIEKLANRNPRKLQQLKEALPKNQTELQSLTYSLLHLVNLLTGLQQGSQEPELTATQRSQKLTQIVKETMVLAATPINQRGQAASLAQINPEVFALFNAAGINANAEKTVSASGDTATAMSLWEKIGQNPAELKANLAEILALTDSTSAEFQATAEKQKRSLTAEIRTLQRQLYRARRKENTIYGRFGLLLEGTNLMSGESLREQRVTTTSAIFTISQELERKQFALDALNQQMQLLPKNARHLRKALVFLLKQLEENKALENDKT